MVQRVNIFVCLLCFSIRWVTVIDIILKGNLSFITIESFRLSLFVLFNAEYKNKNMYTYRNSVIGKY